MDFLFRKQFVNKELTDNLKNKLLEQNVINQLQDPINKPNKPLLSFKSWLTKTGQDFEVNRINISSVIRVKDIINLSGEEISLLINLKLLGKNINQRILKKPQLE